MNFWEDASPATKGAVIVGGIAILYFVVAMFAGLPPYGGGESEVTQQRGGPNAVGAAASGGGSGH